MPRITRAFFSKMVTVLIMLQLVLMPVASVGAEDLARPEVAVESPGASPPVTEPIVESAPTTETTTVVDTSEITIGQEAATVLATSTESIIIEPVTETVSPETKSYALLMRAWSDARAKGTGNDPALQKQFDDFAASEQTRLQTLGVANDKIESYLKRLEFQKNNAADPSAPVENEPRITIPANPAKFNFYDPQVDIHGVNVNYTELESKLSVVRSAWNDLFSVDQVLASPISRPVLADVKPDGEQVVFSADMTELVNSLNRNPVAIYNYVRQTVVYEPYFGAKKGAVGCWREKKCNDTDANSLLIALMRAAGVPARYVKGVAVMPVETVRKITGVDETKTAYAALFVSRVPVFTVSGNNIGANYDAADFSQEKYLGVEWTATEIYYDYDERGGNTSNQIDFTAAQTDQEVQAVFLSSEREKQWLPLDAVVQPYTRVVNEIAPDAANFNGATFWNSYLQYQGALSPTEKYASDIKNQTGKDVALPGFQSGSAVQFTPAKILPPKLPYVLSEGQRDDGSNINIARWSVLPTDRVFSVTVSLKRAANNEVVLTKQIPAAQILNTPFSLSYRGATPMDAQIIESYGGIAYTPAELVQLTSVFGSDAAELVVGAAPVTIGESLIFSFEYFYGLNKLYQDEKFSLAGNEEGAYIVGSVVLDDPNLTTPEAIVFAGNGAIAREYLKTIAKRHAILTASLDRSSGREFLRAVVTQNRVLTKVQDIPTTFDFKGLSIDAAAYTTDYSRRGNYKDRRREYRLLYGLEASYYEGQLFNDLAGLDGISTVKGLQYANANPGAYTMHVINANNEAEIDQLALSANTKANMHADVQKGNTINTPDKPVTKGEFSGILYTSIAPDFTGTYAIGEQVQNGGFTVDNAVLSEESPDNGITVRIASVANNNYTFSAQDRLSGTTQYCKISDIDKVAVQAIMDNELTEYGKKVFGRPCGFGTTEIVGNKKRSYILTTNAVKFVDVPLDFAGAGHWVPVDYPSRNDLQPIVWKMQQYINAQKTLPNDDLNYLASGQLENLSFSNILGTFKRSICETDGLRNCGKYATVYYIPYHNNNEYGKIYRVRGDLLSKLDVDGKLVIKRLGLPQSDEKCAAKSGEVTAGVDCGAPGEVLRVYQDFEYGQLYKYRKWTFDWVHYTYGGVWQEHNKVRGGKQGTNTFLGFPQADPKTLNNLVFQEFEADNEISWDLNNGATSVQAYKKYRCELYPGDISDPFTATLITAHGVLDTGLKTLDDMGSLVMPILKGIAHPVNTYNEVKAFSDELAKISDAEALAMLKSAGSAIYNELEAEYRTSLGPNGCDARTNYIAGRALGEVLLFLVPASKLKAAAKVRILTRFELAFPGLKLSQKLGYFGKLMKISKADDVVEWNRVKAILDSNAKGSAGEDFVKRFIGEAEDNIKFPTKLGDRIPDWYDAKTGLAHEVKTLKDKASYSGDIADQVAKDIELMNLYGSSYRPVWHFVEAGPTQPLREKLEEVGIDFIEYTSL